MVVPCGNCTACCRSSYFIHVQSHDRQTIERIPADLLFPAPLLPEGNYVLGYDRKGHCAMLKEEKCSIYSDRPLTCRQYDCRIFAATGLDPAVDGKVPVSEQAKLWTFEFLSRDDSEAFSAVQMAAQFLILNKDYFPPEYSMNNMTQIAVMAVSIYNLFLGQNSLESVDIEKTVQRIGTVKHTSY